MDGEGWGLRLSDPETGVFKLFHGVLSHTKKNTLYLSISENSDCQAEYGGAFITVNPEFRKLR